MQFCGAGQGPNLVRPGKRHNGTSLELPVTMARLCPRRPAHDGVGALRADFSFKCSHDRDDGTGLDLDRVHLRELLRHRDSVHGRQLRTYWCCPKVRRQSVVTLELGVWGQFDPAGSTEQPRRGQSTATIPAGVHVSIVSPLLGDVRHIALRCPTRSYEALILDCFETRLGRSQAILRSRLAQVITSSTTAPHRGHCGIASGFIDLMIYFWRPECWTSLSAMRGATASR